MKRASEKQLRAQHIAVAKSLGLQAAGEAGDAENPPASNTRQVSSLKRERASYKAQADSIAAEMKVCLEKIQWARQQLEAAEQLRGKALELPALRGVVSGLALDLRRFLGEPLRDVEQLAHSEGLRIALGLASKPPPTEEVPSPTGLG